MVYSHFIFTFIYRVLLPKCSFYVFYFFYFGLHLIRIFNMKSPNFSGSIGSQIMIAQEQFRHQKRLDEIYNKGGMLSPKTLNYDYIIKSSFRSPTKMSKKAFNEELNHHLTLKHLIQRLNSPKSYYERLKDENDFIAYPSLFFRNTQKPTKNKKTQKQKKFSQTPVNGSRPNKKSDDMSNMNTSKKHPSVNQKKAKKTQQNKAQQFHESASVNSEQPYNGLTLQKVVDELPQLQKFEKKDIELFADHLTRLIFKFNLNTMDDIEFLFECVEQYLPQHYPQHFVDAIQNMFKQIVSSLNIEE